MERYQINSLTVLENDSCAVGSPIRCCRIRPGRVLIAVNGYEDKPMTKEALEPPSPQEPHGDRSSSKPTASESSFYRFLQQALTLGAKRVQPSVLPQLIGFLVYVALVGFLASSLILNRPQATAAALVMLMIVGIMSILLLFDISKRIHTIVLDIILLLVVFCFLVISGYAAFRLLNPQPVPPPIPLPSGHTVLMEGWTHFDRSGFVFRTANITAWNDPTADILAAAYDKDHPDEHPARFMVPYNKEPYRDPGAAAGEAGILQMTFDRLDGVNECPVEGYQYHWVDPQQGEIFCLRTRDGHHYAKIKVEEVLPNQIAFDWVFQPSGARVFK
jgi:hypothetical protein